jgi:DNA-binding NarL/FixJ family response regulator
MSDEPLISVMVVDDHPIWRDGVARDLTEHGFDVRAGASGYLVKSASAAELVDAVHRTAAGDPVFTAGLAGLVLGEYRRMADAPAEGPEPPRLTERETDVLRLVAKGLTARQIAERLVLSHRTVENHVQSTLRKLQLHNRVELARYAIEHGLDEE